MAIMNPAEIPDDRGHLESEDRRRLLHFELLVAGGRFQDAQDIMEDLWFEATDAHKKLYQGLSNALTAAVARDARQLRGATEIAHRTRALLAPYPRRVLGIDLDAVLESLRIYIERGDGPVLLLRQG